MKSEEDDLDYCPDCDSVLRFNMCVVCGWKEETDICNHCGKELKQLTNELENNEISY